MGQDDPMLIESINQTRMGTKSDASQAEMNAGTCDRLLELMVLDKGRPEAYRSNGALYCTERLLW